VFNLYSKAAILILVIWWITWSILRSKPHYLLWGSIGLGALLVMPDNPVRQALETLFSKEIALGSGDLEDNRRVLAGRGFIWEQCWERWKKQGLEHKILGTGTSPGTHNEFLRILFSAGLLGLLINIIVLAGVGLMLLKLIHVRRSAVDIIALMVFQMWLIDCTGLHPGLYPTYQWLVWGTIGLAIGGTQQVHEATVTGIHGTQCLSGSIGAELAGHNIIGCES
jgi:O-antigen ligase